MRKWKLVKKLICSLLISSQFLSFSALPGAVYALTEPNSTSSSTDNKKDDKKSSKREFVEHAAEYAAGQILIEAMIEGVKHVPDMCHWVKNKWDERDKDGYNSIMVSKDNLMDSIYADNDGRPYNQGQDETLYYLINSTNNNEKFKENDKNIYGQEQAKDKMFSYVMSSLYNIDKLRNNKKSKENISGNVIYLIGPSGCGKTTMAKAVAESILKDTGRSLFFIDPSAISADKTLDRQLFKTLMKKDLKSENKDFGFIDRERKAPILEFIRKHKESVVIIDDYDKMKMLQANMFAKNIYENYDEIPEDRTADEVIKSIAETGRYYVDGDEVDCRKVLFIITSNEGADELKFNFGIGGDIGGGYQRLKIVEFERLSLDACKKIVRRMLCKATKELTDYNGKFKLNSFEVDEDSINAMAQDIYNDQTSQGRLERTLYNDIIAMFSLNIGEEFDQSFKVKYTPASKGELLGTFEKTRVFDRNLHELKTIDSCGQGNLYPIIQETKNDFAGDFTVTSVLSYKELIRRLSKIKVKNMHLSLVDNLDGVDSEKIKIINQKILTRLLKQIEQGNWIYNDSVKIIVDDRKNAPPEVTVEFVNTKQERDLSFAKKLNNAANNIKKVLNSL